MFVTKFLTVDFEVTLYNSVYSDEYQLYCMAKIKPNFLVSLA